MQSLKSNLARHCGDFHYSIDLSGQSLRSSPNAWSAALCGRNNEFSWKATRAGIANRRRRKRKDTKDCANGRQQLIGIERAGNALAEVPFLTKPLPSNRGTVSDIYSLALGCRPLRTICLRHPEVALKIIKVLAHRMRASGRSRRGIILLNGA